jgi:hypothetical protein
MSFHVDGLAAIASRQHSVSPLDAIAVILAAHFMA